MNVSNHFKRIQANFLCQKFWHVKLTPVFFFYKFLIPAVLMFLLTKNYDNVQMNLKIRRKKLHTYADSYTNVDNFTFFNKIICFGPSAIGYYWQLYHPRADQKSNTMAPGLEPHENPSPPPKPSPP